MEEEGGEENYGGARQHDTTEPQQLNDALFICTVLAHLSCGHLLCSPYWTKSQELEFVFVDRNLHVYVI